MFENRLLESTGRRATIRIYGAFLICQPFAFAAAIHDAKDVTVLWQVLLMAVSLGSCAIGVGLVALARWVLRPLPYWIPVHIAALPFVAVLLGLSSLDGVVSALFVGGLLVMVYRFLVQEVNSAV
jgi:hypothetical protein